MGFTSDLEALSTQGIIDTLSVKIYEPPLSDARDRMKEVPDPLRVLVLILDFNTEVEMQGIMGFLENSTGRFLLQTIDAFDAIGAHQTATVLRSISDIMKKRGFTHESLRADFADAQEFQISSFHERHGKAAATMAEEVDRASRNLYMYANSMEPVWELLVAFLEQRRQQLLEEMSRVAS